MRKVVKYIALIIVTIVLFTSIKVNAKVSNYDEAWEYVTNKENGYCGYKTDDIVVGIKIEGIAKGVDSYVYHKTSGLITEKKVFSPQGYEKGTCPKYAQAQAGYIDGNAVYGIMISDHTNTLGSGDTGNWEPATYGYTFNSGAMEVQFDASKEDGEPDTNPSPEILEAFENIKSNYDKKYICLYVDETNRMVFGNNGDISSGSLYIGYETMYDIKSIGKLDNSLCANYAKIISGTYEDKVVTKVFLSDSQKSLTSLTASDMGVNSIIIASDILNNSKTHGIESPDLDTDIPEINTCNMLLGYPSQEGSPAYYLVRVFNVIKYVAIILLIVLSLMDLFSAIASQDKDMLKKTANKILKRFILCIVIFLLPYLVGMLLKYIANRQADICGIR